MAIVQRLLKNGETRYQARVKDHAGQWFKSRFHDRRADAVLEERGLAELRKKAAKRISADARKTRVREYFAVWADECRDKTSEGWKMSQDQMYRDYVNPVIGSMLMANVERPDIGRVLKRARKLGRAEGTVLQIFLLLQKMFNDAVDYWEMLHRSPVSSAHHRPAVKQTERDFLKPAQAWTLLVSAREHEYLGPPVFLGLLAGLRYEATAALLWPSVLWDQNQILICRAYKRKEKRIADYPKGGDWEYVPLPSLLRDYLWRIYSGLSPAEQQGFVSPGPRGGMLSYHTLLPALRRLCKAAGVPEIEPHELRHSSTEIYVNAGANDEDLSRLLNHKDPKTTRRYKHRGDARLSRIAASIDEASFDVGNETDEKGFPRGKPNTIAIREEEET